MKKVSFKAKRRFFLLSVFCVAVLTFFVASIFQDWVQIVHNKQDISSMNKYYANLLEEEESLTSEVTKLHDSDYVARYAREKYMYSLPGEIIIKMSEDNVKKEN